jgi:TDG/mug DNA glycosylase family protein
MEKILSIPLAAEYEARCSMLKAKRVSLWDVLKICARSSSLDSDIVESSIVPNDFEGFLASHPNIELICFNGAKAEKSFTKHVLPNLQSALLRTSLVRLPSTSPANASIPVEVNLNKWEAIAA